MAGRRLAARGGRAIPRASKHAALGEWSTTSYVVEHDPCRVFAWAVGDPGQPSATWRFTLRPEQGGTTLSQWMRLGPGRSGLSIAIDQMPDKEQKIVFVRMREFEESMTRTLAADQDPRRAGLMRTATTRGCPARHLGRDPRLRPGGREARPGHLLGRRGLGVRRALTAGVPRRADQPVAARLGHHPARHPDPPLIAMTAMTLAQLSGGRFLLGLGPSGPQVIEGLHGLPFARPLARMRETIEVVRQAFSGEKITYSGTQFQIPLPGDSRPMRLSLPANPGIPIYIASMSPRMLELTGTVADGWLGTSFVPEGSAAYFEHLDRGLAASGRGRSDLDVCQGAEVAFLEDEDEALAHVAHARKSWPSASAGWDRPARTSTARPTAGRAGPRSGSDPRALAGGDHDGAAALVTDEMVLATTLIGTEQMVRERLRVWRNAGVDTVRLYPAGGTLDRRLATLARAIELVKTIG